MTIGSDYLRDERQRISDLVGQVDLRTERRYRAGSGPDLDAGVAGDRPIYLVRYEGGDIRTATGNVHRRYQVRTTAIEWPTQDEPSYTEQLVRLHTVIRIGYAMPGGDRISGSPEQVDDIAAEDVECVRQQLWHWNNFNTPTGSGITAGRGEITHFGMATAEESPDLRRVIWTLPITSDLIVETQPPQTFTRTP